MDEPHKPSKVIEFLQVYGWAILIVLAALAALAYFGVFGTPVPPPSPSVNVYDCGNIYVRGVEQTKGELENASFALKRAINTPLNETTFNGRFLKAYYDMDSCLPYKNSTSLNITGSIRNVTG